MHNLQFKTSTDLYSVKVSRGVDHCVRIYLKLPFKQEKQLGIIVEIVFYVQYVWYFFWQKILLADQQV